MLVWAGETFRKCNGLNELRRCVYWLELGRMETGARGGRDAEGEGGEGQGSEQRGREACYGALRNREYKIWRNMEYDFWNIGGQRGLECAIEA